jgi:hypothetical protein
MRRVVLSGALVVVMSFAAGGVRADPGTIGGDAPCNAEIAGPGAPAINLAWDECVASDEALINKNFACDTNAGSDVMFASFIAPAGIDQFIALECTFEFVQPTSAGTTVAWWQLKGAGAKTQRARLGLDRHGACRCQGK